MIREAQAVVLLLLGNAVLRLGLGDGHLDYVKPSMQIPLIVSGALLAVLGAARLLELVRRRPVAAHTVPDPVVTGHQHGHDHSRGPRVAWLLVLPVFAILLVAPPPLGSYAAGRDDGTVAAPTGAAAYPALPAGDPVELPLEDYAVRAVWDAGRTLSGRTVELTGFVTPGQNGGWYLTRMTLVCCAADARAIKVDIRGAAAPPADTWVRLRGTYRPSADPDPEKAVPVLDAEDVTEIAAPNETYA